MQAFGRHSEDVCNDKLHRKGNSELHVWQMYCAVYQTWVELLTKEWECRGYEVVRELSIGPVEISHAPPPPGLLSGHLEGVYMFNVVRDNLE